MGNAPSSSYPLDSSSSRQTLVADPAMVGMEGDLEKLGLPTTTKDHRRRRNQQSSKFKKSVDAPAMVAAESGTAPRGDPAMLGMQQQDLVKLGIPVSSDFSNHSSSKTMDGSSGELSSRNTSSTSGRQRRSKNKDSRASNHHQSFQDHLQEIEQFVTAVQNSKDAKRQLREFGR